MNDNSNTELNDKWEEENEEEFLIDSDPDIALKNFTAIGNMTLNEAIEILRELEDRDSVKLLDDQIELLKHNIQSDEKGLSPISTKLSNFKPFNHCYKSLNYEVGYINPKSKGKTPLMDAKLIKSEKLRKKKIKIILERIYTEDLPGIKKNYNVLFHFYVKTKKQSVNFIKYLRLRKNDYASTKNKPIFDSIDIGDDGLTLKIKIINLKNDHDEKLLGFLKSKEIDVTLNIITKASPIINIVSHMALGITKAVLKYSKKNHIVQEIDNTFNFSQSPLAIKFRQGSYIFIQIPKEDLKDWKWDDWEYNGTQIVNKGNNKLTPKYNYLIIGFYI